MTERTSGSTSIEPLPVGLVKGLSDPAAYPDDPSAPEGVSTVQTHISHVFMTGSRVYKLRKSLRPGFLDFGSRRARNEDCLREVALNRRLAPGVYLGVASVRVEASGAHVGPVTESLADPALEHCVVMRRLPRGRDALSLLQRDALGDHHVDAIAKAIAAFHQAHALGRPAPFSSEEWLKVISGPVEDNFDPLTDVFDDGRLSRLGDGVRAFMRAHPDRFDVRRRDGRAVDGRTGSDGVARPSFCRIRGG